MRLFPLVQCGSNWIPPRVSSILLWAQCCTRYTELSESRVGTSVSIRPLAKLAGQIAVDVKSAKTGDNARDRQMHESVLESERFPEAIFSPDHVTGRLALSGESALEVHGSLHLHGSEHAMTIPVRVKIENGLVTATAKFVVPYVAWGMKDPSNLILRVDKTVEVEVALAGTRQEK